MNTLRLLLAAALVALAATVHADDHGRRVPLLAVYQQECSSCHVAYPPGLLPAASWQRLMRTLPRHFGTDASLDAPTQQAIAIWLEANAASGWRRSAEAPPEDRITKGAWFRREHREVPADAWQRAAVRSASNCAACHTGAADGDFSEHRVRIPQ